MSTKKTTLSAAALAAAGALVVGGAAMANAATSTGTAPATATQQTQQAQPGQPGQGGPQLHQHSAASAAEATAVKAAVAAKDSTITVQSVEKDADGSFDVHGTKAGAPVMVEVSKDYKTVEVRTGGPGGPGGHGGRGGHGRPMGTPATDAQKSSVTAAVKAKDSAVTVEDVMVAPDGSFHARATKAGAPVHVVVSKDLKTVTVETGRGGPGGRGGRQDAPATAAQKASVTAAVKAKDSAITVTDVKVDPDGSYDAFGTKAGAPVMVEVSKDLKTIEVRTGGPQGGPMGPQGQQGQQGPQSPTNIPSAPTSGAANTSYSA